MCTPTDKLNYIRIHLAGESFHLGSESIYTRDYKIEPADDINSVGHNGSCVARNIFYFGNANPDEELVYSLDSCRFIGENKVQLASSLYRKEDGQLIAKIFTIKECLSPLKLHLGAEFLFHGIPI